jgi:hypothetical protein
MSESPRPLPCGANIEGENGGGDGDDDDYATQNPRPIASEREGRCVCARACVVRTGNDIRHWDADQLRRRRGSERESGTARIGRRIGLCGARGHHQPGQRHRENGDSQEHSRAVRW